MRSPKILLLVVISAICAEAQLPVTPQRGLSPVGSYSISDIESINNVTGNVTLSIPLAPMPPGRGAHLGPFRLTYNSAIYNSLPNSTGNGSFINLVENSGWRYSTGYGLRIQTKACLYQVDNRQFKYELNTPDGGAKELTLRDDPDSLDGYSPVGPDGKQLGLDCQTSTTFPGLVNGKLIFYTSDGSYIRFEFLVADFSWAAYMPEGMIVYGKGESTLLVFDRNNWATVYSTQFDPVALTATRTSKEIQVPARTVILSFGLSQPVVDTITWDGFGQSLSAQATWSLFNVTPQNYECAPNVNCTLPTAVFAVSSITVPGPASQQYDFTYRDSTAANCDAAFVYCLGQLGRVKFPTGVAGDRLEVAYKYAKEGQQIYANSLDLPISSRTVKYVEHMDGETGSGTERTETTTYSFSNDSSTVTTSGGTTPHSFYNTQSHPISLRGLVYKTVNPDGSQMERLWWRNRTNNTHDNDPGNPYVRLEVRSIPNSSGIATLATAKFFTIDRNGNPTLQKDYDWVSATTNVGILRTDGKVTGIVNGATTPAMRITSQTWHRSTTNAGDGTVPGDETNAYWNPSAPRNLRAINRTEVGRESQVIIPNQPITLQYTARAVSSVGWDAAFANKTSERHWDDQMDSAVPTTLTTLNSIGTSYTYSSTCQGGLVDEVTDPNGYITKYTYAQKTPDDQFICLFPDTVTRAYGRAEAQKTTFTYDSTAPNYFKTGLVIKVEDPNLVSTTFDYDILGRPIETVAASGTTAAQKTTINYDDANRTVTTKQDVSALNDGKAITVSYLDSRGLAWLTVQSENGTVQSSSCTADCIKTEQRLAVQAGKTYAATSNPYRPHDTAANPQVPKDPDTKGWTLVVKDKGGRVESQASYSGAMPSGNWWLNPAGLVGQTQVAYDGKRTS